ncbi:ATP-dependent DNA ligase [Amycolatopsis sp. TRM77291]
MAVLRPPVSLPLAQAVRDVPTSQPGREWLYQAKFDGWRSLLFAADGVLQSRRDNDLADRFPEIVDAGAQLGDVVLDGEIVALREGRLDFGALTSAPGTRGVEGIGIYFVAFDLLADERTDYRTTPCRERWDRLQRRFAGVEPPLQLVPSTTDRDAAMAWMRPEASQVGIEGIVAKRADSPYRPGRTGSSWVKIRTMVVVDAVVVGVTGSPERPDELVLARPDDTGELRTIGLSQPITPAMARQVGEHVTLTGEPARKVSSGAFGRGRTEFRPVRPELVVEVAIEASVATFSSRLRPRVHRIRADLAVEDLNG